MFKTGLIKESIQDEHSCIRKNLLKSSGSFLVSLRTDFQTVILIQIDSIYLRITV